MNSLQSQNPQRAKKLRAKELRDKEKTRLRLKKVLMVKINPTW